MHQVDFDLSLEEITKIEGAATLNVNVRGGVVEECKFGIAEYKRFYTQAMVGKPAQALPQHLARICGTCSNAHIMASIRAVEHALGITPSAQTQVLRALTMDGLMIRDHALHLYLFSLPDLLGKDSILALNENNEEEHQLLHDAFEVKAAGNHLSQLVAGRSVHAPIPVVGGFLKIPDAGGIEKCRRELEQIRPAVLRLIGVYAESPFNLTTKTNYVALTAHPYSFLQGELCASNVACIPEEKFMEHLSHVVVPYSQASAYAFQGELYRVGALARLNLNKDALEDRTKTDTAKYLSRFPSDNAYDNNLAQAIEILHCIDEALEFLSTHSFYTEAPQRVEPRAGEGIGVIEAPRGTLYHKVVLDEKGIVTHGDIVVPTGQNQLAIEWDIKMLIEKWLEEGKEFDNKKALEHEIEQLIRAYDPCMSCAAHFLEVTWDGS
ncbi:MAG: nickel-dependent hydrogenase large subunit [Patescibacteria group bacterium]